MPDLSAAGEGQRETPKSVLPQAATSPPKPPKVTQIVIHAIEQPPPRIPHPCEVGAHRWAWLNGGGQACGRCGTRR
jgi:hypothetical protein